MEYLRGWLRPRAERQLLKAAKIAAASVGAPLLEAHSLDDLDDRLNEAIEKIDLFDLNTLVAQQRAIPEQPPLRTEPTPRLRECLGEGPARAFVATEPLWRAASSVLSQFVAEYGFERLVDEAWEFKENRARLFAAPHVHSAVKAAILESMFAAACFLGIAHAVLKRRRVEPWLGMALVERAAKGMREYLRFAAAFAKVPESIVAPEERLDLARLQEEVDAAEARLLTLAELRMRLEDGRIVAILTTVSGFRDAFAGDPETQALIDEVLGCAPS